MNFGTLFRLAPRFGAVVVIAASLGACSMMPDWLTGDDSSDTTTVADDSGASAPDQTASTDQKQITPPGSPDANGNYPDLADTPDRPTPPSTSDQQKDATDSLGAAGAAQTYAADQLKAGTETAAAPPSPDAPPEQEDVAASDSGQGAGADAGKSAPASTDASSSAAASGSGASSADSTATAAAAAPTTPVASTPAPAMSGPPSGPPAVPAVPNSSVVGAQPMQMSDAQLGFQPSKAPPLDASVAQFVPQPIIARYRQTASLGGASGISTGAAVPAVAAKPYTGPAIGGPEQMSGAVVANFDALNGGAVAPSVYANADGLPPMASVMFPRDTTILSAEAKAQVQAAAQNFIAQGGNGYIRVVGHSASRSANMSVSRHLQWDFEHSQARANSVARALIAAGVPATHVLVEAVGDNNTGDEQSSRRADIFIQS
jgi:OmpA family